ANAPLGTNIPMSYSKQPLVQSPAVHSSNPNWYFLSILIFSK
ncbi:4818_t:CDS:1, partial [Gigaspora rosea]